MDRHIQDSLSNAISHRIVENITSHQIYLFQKNEYGADKTNSYFGFRLTWTRSRPRISATGKREKKNRTDHHK